MSLIFVPVIFEKERFCLAPLSLSDYPKACGITVCGSHNLCLSFILSLFNFKISLVFDVVIEPSWCGSRAESSLLLCMAVVYRAWWEEPF